MKCKVLPAIFKSKRAFCLVFRDSKGAFEVSLYPAEDDIVSQISENARKHFSSLSQDDLNSIIEFRFLRGTFYQSLFKADSEDPVVFDLLTLISDPF